eukprot:7344090-Pyramimonas_sp.AAC.1
MFLQVTPEHSPTLRLVRDAAVAVACSCLGHQHVVSANIRGDIRKHLGGEMNFPEVEWLNRGLIDNPQLWHFFGVHEYLGGELNSTVVEWLNKGLMAASSPKLK